MQGCIKVCQNSHKQVPIQLLSSQRGQRPAHTLTACYDDVPVLTDAGLYVALCVGILSRVPLVEEQLKCLGGRPLRRSHDQPTNLRVRTQMWPTASQHKQLPRPRSRYRTSAASCLFLADHQGFVISDRQGFVMSDHQGFVISILW